MFVSPLFVCLYVRQSPVCLPVCTSVTCLSASMFVIFLFVCLYVRQSPVCLPVCTSVTCLSACMFVSPQFLCLYVRQSRVCLYVRQSRVCVYVRHSPVCLPVCTSVTCLSACMFVQGPPSLTSLEQTIVSDEPKLQALVYDILPSTTAVFSYTIGSRKLSANDQFFVGAQTVVSLLQTTQIKQGVSFIAANKVYTTANETTIV